MVWDGRGCSCDDALRFRNRSIDDLIDPSMPCCKSVDSKANACTALLGVQSPSCAEFIFLFTAGDDSLLVALCEHFVLPAAAGMGIFRPGFQKVVVTPSVCDVHTLFYEQWHDVFDIQTKLSGIIYVVFIFPVAQARFRSRVLGQNN